MRSYIFIGFLFAVTQLTSCYQKKADKSARWSVEQYADEYEVLEDSTENVFFIDTFQLININTYASNLKTNVKGTLAFEPLRFKEVTIEDTLEVLQQFAISELNIEIGKILNNKNLIRQGNKRIEYLSSLFCEEEYILHPEDFPIDSLSNKIKLFYLDAFNYEHKVYAEAYKWLANLHFVLLQQKNVKNTKKYNTIIEQLIENGDEMLVRLYAFQEYEPLANFSQQLITIIEHSEKKLPNSTLLKLVTEDLKSFGQSNE